MNTGNIIVGRSDNEIFTDKEGRFHFSGSTRPNNINVIDATYTDPTHQNQLGLTSLAAANGIAADGLDSVLATGRTVEVVGVDSGVFTKGVNNGTYTRKDTTSLASIVLIRLTTMYGTAAWSQSSEWRLILDIATGPITGKFTIIMPAFSLEQYSTIEYYITTDGAVYFNKDSSGFDTSMSGPSYATVNMLNDEEDGSNVVIEVANTTGFYEGFQVRVSDSTSSEISRITNIVSNTSITVDTLINSYATASGAKLEVLEFIQTAPTFPSQRGLAKVKLLKTGINSGFSYNYGIPYTTDPASGLTLQLLYIPTTANTGTDIIKMRVQYFLSTIGDIVPQSIQEGTIIEVDVSPPPVANMQYLSYLCTIPEIIISNKWALGVQIARMGSDSEDDFTGDVNFIAILMSTYDKQLGSELA